jgi:hypothetical protein
VKDATGRDAGVTVEAASPALIEKGPDGHHRWRRANRSSISAAPTVTFVLPGFAAVKREDRIDDRLHGERQRRAEGGRRRETITVSGASPLVDVSLCRRSACSRDVIDACRRATTRQARQPC